MSMSLFISMSISRSMSMSVNHVNAAWPSQAACLCPGCTSMSRLYVNVHAVLMSMSMLLVHVQAASAYPCLHWMSMSPCCMSCCMNMLLGHMNMDAGEARTQTWARTWTQNRDNDADMDNNWTWTQTLTWGQKS
jgi:hypothetical protein